VGFPAHARTPGTVGGAGSRSPRYIPGGSTGGVARARGGVAALTRTQIRYTCTWAAARQVEGILDACDLLLIVGTSAVVYPAAG
jgi:hypothetical protein